MLQNNRNNNTIYIYFIICLLYVYLFILLLRVDLIETAISTSTTASTPDCDSILHNCRKNQELKWSIYCIQRSKKLTNFQQKEQQKCNRRKQKLFMNSPIKQTSSHIVRNHKMLKCRGILTTIRTNSIGLQLQFAVK